MREVLPRMTRIKRIVSKKIAVRVLPFTLIILAATLGVIGVSQIVNQVGAAGNMSGTYFDHVVIIVMEDHGMIDICARNPPPCSSTNGDPYTAGLANTYGIGTRYLGVSHFSQADYIALLGGGTYGCVSYPCQPSSHVNLVDRLEAAGLSWKGYMENQAVAGGCDVNYKEPYTPEHNPFVFFKDITSNAARCSKLVLANPSSCSATDCALINDLNSASAPNFMWLTPNNCNNMHGYAGGCASSIPTGDNYLSSLVPNILGSQTFKTKRSALLVVFDEGNGYCPLNNSSEDCVYAVWAGHEVKTSFVTSKLYDHYSFTRTIEANWKLTSLGSKDASAIPMTEFFANAPPPPTQLQASFTYSPSSPQVNQQITFTGSATGGTAPYTFTWAFGDGSTGTGNTAAHAYHSTGSFNVSLTVNDNGSPKQSTTSQHSVPVTNPPPQPPSPLTASFSYSPQSPTAGQQITFTGYASGGTSPYTFNWSFGDGSTATGSTTTHTYPSAGSYTTVLKASDSGSPKQTASSQQTISVSSPPPPPPPPPTLTASFTYSPSSPQTGQQVTFTGTASGGTSPYSYTWNFGDSSTGIGSTSIHTYGSPGSFTVTLTVKDNGSPQQTTTSRQSVTITSPPPPPSPLTVSFSYNPSSPSVGQQVTFTASATGGTAPYSLSWTFGDGSTGTGPSTSHTYSSGGTFTIILTARDSGSPQQAVSSQQSVAITAPPPPPPPPLTTSFTYAPSNPVVLVPVHFVGSASGGTAPYTYSWDFGDGSTATGASVSRSYLLSGTYTVTLTVTDANGQTATVSKTVIVSLPLLGP
jgi:PKD repeat protein